LDAGTQKFGAIILCRGSQNRSLTTVKNWLSVLQQNRIFIGVRLAFSNAMAGIRTQMNTKNTLITQLTNRIVGQGTSEYATCKKSQQNNLLNQIQMEH
jgi:hypothetical protein